MDERERQQLQRHRSVFTKTLQIHYFVKLDNFSKFLQDIPFIKRPAFLKFTACTDLMKLDHRNFKPDAFYRTYLEILF